MRNFLVAPFFSRKFASVINLPTLLLNYSFSGSISFLVFLFLKVLVPVNAQSFTSLTCQPLLIYFKLPGNFAQSFMP